MSKPCQISSGSQGSTSHGTGSEISQGHGPSGASQDVGSDMDTSSSILGMGMGNEISSVGGSMGQNTGSNNQQGIGYPGIGSSSQSSGSTGSNDNAGLVTGDGSTSTGIGG